MSAHVSKALCADINLPGVALVRDSDFPYVRFLHDFDPFIDVGPTGSYLVTKVHAFIANLAFRHD